MADFLSLLPPNASEFERTLEQATARVGQVPVAIRDFWSADTVPEALMPWLGWEWSVDSWDPDWPVETKRAVLRDAFKVHQRKGTVQSVTDAINALGSNIAIREWFDYTPPRTPYTFDVTLDTGSGSGGGVLQQQLIDAIDATMPVRCHYDLSVATNGTGSLNLYGYGRVGRFQRLSMQDPLALGIALHHFVHVQWPQYWSDP